MPTKPDDDLKKSIFFQLFPTVPSKGESRKYDIIEAAIDCFVSEGITQTTLEAIGKRLGIRRSHVAYHFPTLTAVIEQALQYVASTAQHMTVEKLRRAQTWEEQVDAYVSAPFDWCKQFPSHTEFMMLFFHLSTGDRAFKMIHDKVRAAGRERILLILKSGIRSKDETPLLLAAVGIQNLITGAMVDQVTTGPVRGDCSKSAAEGLISLEQRREATVFGAWAIIRSHQE